jgi:hypothetical protein
MPVYSYWAAAFGHLASYIVMFAISSVLGAKYYPIPYRWGRLALIFIIMGGVYGISMLIDHTFFSSVTISQSSVGMILIKLSVHTALIALYAVSAWYTIRKR